jgi:hypothetical protein
MSDSNFGRGHDWMPTDLWVSSYINTSIHRGDFDEEMILYFPTHDEMSSRVIEAKKSERSAALK